MAFRFRPVPSVFAHEPIFRWMESVRQWFAYMFGRTEVADADYTTVGDYRIAITSLTAPRTITISTLDITKPGTTGREFVINDESGLANTHNITVATQGSETINGADTATISTNYGSLRLYTNGSNLFTTE